MLPDLFLLSFAAVVKVKRFPNFAEVDHLLRLSRKALVLGSSPNHRVEVQNAADHLFGKMVRKRIGVLDYVSVALVHAEVHTKIGHVLGH